MWLLQLLACGGPACTDDACLTLGEAAGETAEAVALYDAGCAQDDLEACLRAAMMREGGHGVPVDNAGAWAGYEQVCAAGRQSACVGQATMLLRGTAPGGSDVERATALLSVACEADEAFGCANLGQALVQSGALGEAQGAYAAACALDHLPSCTMAQELLRVPPPPPADPCVVGSTACSDHLMWQASWGTPEQQAASRDTFERLCEADDGFGCTGLGFLYSQALGVSADPERAAALYERGCRLGEPGGCFSLAILLREGRGVAQDMSRAETLFGRACEVGEVAACLMQGNTLADLGRFEASLDRYQRACDMGLPMGCANLAVSLLDPEEGVDAQPERALVLAEQACLAGEPVGCAVLGRELVLGRHVPADPVTGRRLLEDACRFGHAAACRDLQEIR